MHAIQNTITLLDRALRAVGIPLRKYEEVKRGEAQACLALLRRLLFFTSREVAAQAAVRAGPPQALAQTTSGPAASAQLQLQQQQPHSLNGMSDRRIVLLAFDLLRDVCRFSPVLTPEQFLSKSYADKKVRGWGRGENVGGCLLVGVTSVADPDLAPPLCLPSASPLPLPCRSSPLPRPLR